ncbi:MAG: thiol peroxidase [Lentisphaeria bacterium]|nr:thiol peroxidase [Lentisphaeria bacterium]
MEEHVGGVTFKGSPLTLVGRMPAAGDTVPDVTVLGRDLGAVRLSDFRGKVMVLVTVPSLDTSVCDMEVRRFNREAAGMGPDAVIVVASVDLPFAQARWCGAAGVDRVVTVSDHRETALGQAFGVLVRELRLLARCVFVIDREGVLRYTQLVREIAEEPDYGAVLGALRGVM